MSNKFFNVLIPYNYSHAHRSHPDLAHACTEIELPKPLIDRPGEYKLVVSKFRVPTSQLPIASFPIPTQARVSNGRYRTSLGVRWRYPNGECGEIVNVYFTSARDAKRTPRFQMGAKGRVRYDETDPIFYIHSHQHLVDMLNDALEQVVPAFCSCTVEIGDDEKIAISVLTDEENNGGYPEFSPEVWPYLGRGFNIRYMEDRYFYHMYNEGDGGYVTKQDYATLVTWNKCHTILICGQGLPTVAEFFPNMASQNPYEQQCTEPVLSMFLPIPAKAGDMQSDVVYVNQHLAESDLITMNGETPVQKFKIAIHWSDDQGIIHPLYITEGEMATIRLAIVKN